MRLEILNITHPYDTPTFKLKLFALLVMYVQHIKHFLLLRISTANIVPPYFFSAVTSNTFCYLSYFHALYRYGKGHKFEIRSNRIYSTNHTKSKSHHNLYLWPQNEHKHRDTYPCKNDFKKPAAHRPVVCIHLIS